MLWVQRQREKSINQKRLGIGNSPHCVDMPKATALNHVNLTRFNHHTGKQLIEK